MKPFKLVWLRTDTLEKELDSIHGVEKMDEFVKKIEDPTVVNSVKGAYRIFKWNGTRYEPYNHPLRS
jgi:hypothetical protein